MLPKTKIVCTLGPSSWSPEILKQLIDNGMTVARVNGAFSDIAEMERIATAVKSVSNDVALMIDIKGHEVRLNKFEEDKVINPGDDVVIGSDDSEYMYTQTYPDLYKNLHIGDTLLIDDGRTILTVQKVENKKIYAKVIVGQKIPKGKSLNVPGVYLDNPPITERDIEQIKYAVENKWDFVAASFVRSKQDVEAVKELLVGSHTKVISKIEDKFGIENIDEIIEASEGIMVARGDMGIEIPYYRVPHVQKEIIRKCNYAVKPVIVATQMLESMINQPSPTRAEVSDVANAVVEGADAIMLSGETTTGKYPVECVKVMKEISMETERNIYHNIKDHNIVKHFACDIKDDGTELAIAIAQSVANLSFQMPDAKVIVDTRTGFSARLVAAFSLRHSVLALASYDYYARRLALSKGIKATMKDEKINSLENMVQIEEALIEQAKSVSFIKPGDKVILVMAATYNWLPNQKTHEKASIKVLSV